MKIEYNVNPSILQAAKRADADKAQQIINSVQAGWDTGLSFLSTGSVMDDLYPRPRASDSCEEMAEAAKLMQDQLADLALDGAMLSISKDTASAMCRDLGVADPCATIKIYGIEMPIAEFVRRWNAQHPDNAFYLAPAFEA